MLMLGQDELHKCYANDSGNNAPKLSIHNLTTFDLYPESEDGGQCFNVDPLKGHCFCSLIMID